MEFLAKVWAKIKTYMKTFIKKYRVYLVIMLLLTAGFLRSRAKKAKYGGNLKPTVEVRNGNAADDIVSDIGNENKNESNTENNTKNNENGENRDNGRGERENEDGKDDKRMDDNKKRSENEDSNSPSGSRTILINTGLYGKSTGEKRDYLLNNFRTDFVVGDANAKITMIEYASFGCRFCRKQRLEIRKIIDEYALKRKVLRYVFRPLFNTKTIPIGAFLHCAKEENVLSIADEVFAANIDLIDDYQAYLTKLGEKYAMGEDYVKECLFDRDIYEKIIYMQQNSREVFGLEATPVLFINGRKIVGYRSYEQLKSLIEKLLKDK